MMLMFMFLLLAQTRSVAAMDEAALQNLAMMLVMGFFVIIVAICVTVYCVLSTKQAKEIDERLFPDDPYDDATEVM